MRAKKHDDGAATIWVAALIVLVVTATVLVVGATTAAGVRHAAQSAADLAALAGAGRIGVADDACAAAGRVAAANGAVLRRCTATSTGARTGEVRVEVARSARWCGVDLDATARARAGRVPPAAGAAARPPPAGAAGGPGTRCGPPDRVAA